ncbi:IS21 family transposase [Corallococcus exiguus]|uniref:IS21 family transposase n=1 Tax=Corallococcus exiguus TaxID=83462 RepID=UPI001471F93C|nr:IS21 family transposase [Corallococcus exiguus]NNB92032.1 IS21 family transposase [Corallococcus exiguus]
MRKLRELFRLRFEAKLTTRSIAASLGIGNGTVCDYLGRARVAKLAWPLPAELDDDAALTALLFPEDAKAQAERPEPDWARVHAELKKKGVTKLLLWQEYLEAVPGGYQYSRFCERYGRWLATSSVTLRQEHRAGEKCFVDFSGDGVQVVDAVTGEVRVAKLFVAVLGASNLTYVEPVFSEDVATWVGCHVRAFEYFGGVSEVVVPDNLKAGVTRAHRYEPDLNPTYADLARHYGFAILPARPRRPRDKAKVEVGVLLAERWILAALRHRPFTSLAQVQEAVKPLLEKLNTRPMRKLGKSRWELFEQVEKAALRALPARPYELAFWKKARVNIDYHVELEGHGYSVPYTLVGKPVELRHTEGCVEVFLGGRRVASHVRSQQKGRFTTQAEHMPASHRQHAEWTPSRLIRWAEGVGPSCAKLVEELMTRRPHPQQGFRSALGVLRLADEKKYGKPRVEKACARALRHRAVSYKSVLAILQHRLEDADEKTDEKGALPEHENVRGAHYYH